MDSSQVDSQLDSVPEWDLISFLHRKKTEISCNIDDLLFFLTQLKNYNLVPEEVCENAIKKKSKEAKQKYMYEILDWLEKDRGQFIKVFWSCVFQDHILMNFPFLSLLKNSLLKECSRFDVKKAEQKQSGRKRGNGEADEEDAGPSVSSSSQKKPTAYLFEESREELEDFREDTYREEEEESELVDMSMFNGAVLPVTCGSTIAALHKSRFAVGSFSKSIRTEERWLTPEEFVKKEFPLADRHWGKDIRCYGKPLNYLVKMKILDIHSLECCCQLCNFKGPLLQDKDDLCFICHAGGNMVFCTNCPQAFHHNCHLPTLQGEIPGNTWMCTFCLIKPKQLLWNHMSWEGALSNPVSGNITNIMRCACLLMYLYKADKLRLCTDDPSTKEGSYNSVISNPMWLDKVKTKLQEDKFKTTREFVHDINLIFDNCQTFNKDNTYGRMGATMKMIFQKEFETIFKIQY